MSGLPYYPRYPRDFLEGTAGLPFELKGAYGLILDLIYMMGNRGLPDDPHFISGHLGMSVRKWNVIREKLIAAGKIEADLGIISNKRADKEKIIQSKFQDKQRENRSRSNKNNRLQSPRSDHTESESDTYRDSDDDKARARAANQPENPPSQSPTDRERMLTAIGVDPATGLTGYGGAILGTRHDMDLASRWKSELGLTEESIVAVIAETMAKKPDGQPPNSFKYFNRAMQREAARRDEPPLKPEQSNVQVLPPKPGGYRQSRSSAADDAFLRRVNAAARARSPS